MTNVTDYLHLNEPLLHKKEIKLTLFIIECHDMTDGINNNNKSLLTIYNHYQNIYELTSRASQ